MESTEYVGTVPMHAMMSTRLDICFFLGLLIISPGHTH